MDQLDLSPMKILVSLEGNLSHRSSRERGQSQNEALAVPPADPLKACVTENSPSEMIGHDDPAGLPIDAHEIRVTVFIPTNETSLDNSRNDYTGVCLRGPSNECERDFGLQSKSKSQGSAPSPASKAAAKEEI
jgi:hypothetical protein